MSSRIFRSVFKEEIVEYLHSKVVEGCKERSFGAPLSIFDDFLVRKECTEKQFSREMGEEWIICRPEEKDSTRYVRITVVNRFLIHLQMLGYDVVPTGTIRIKHNEYIPHIYNEEEIERYFHAVDSFVIQDEPYLSLVLPVLFRVLLGCGLRINEALQMRKCDVNLEKGTLRITSNSAKNDHERLAVMPQNLIAIMRIYAERCFFMKLDSSYLFSHSNGRPLSDSFVSSIHVRILKKAEIPFIGGGAGPRIHDWRHTAAVRAFRQMIDRGMDTYVALPILSVFLGHKSIVATERYVRLTLDSFDYLESALDSTYWHEEV